MKGSRLPTIIGTIVAGIVIVGGAGLLFIYSGTYDVAASSPPSGIELWLANTVRSHAIDRRDKDIAVPNLEDTALIREGFVHYRDACVDCHGVPGKGREEFASHMNPAPPQFFRTPEQLARMRAFRQRMEAARGEREGGSGGEREAHEKREARSNFWKAKYGVKMTGMPAFGSTHTDQELWSMVAFLQQLRRGMTVAQYDSLVATTPQSTDEEHDTDHSHDNGNGRSTGSSGGAGTGVRAGAGRPAGATTGG